MNKLRAGDGSESRICKIFSIAYLYMLEKHFDDSTETP